MAFLTDFILSSTNQDNCSLISVYDQTDYSTWSSGAARADCGIAIFWSTDGFVTSSGDLSNSTDGWSIVSTSPNTYTINGYIVPVWDGTAVPYINNSIVFSELDNTFYHNSSGGNNSTQPGTHASVGWTALTTSSYSTFNTHVGSGALDYGYTSIQEELTCDKYTLTKLSCYEYELSFAASANTKTVTLYEYNGTTALEVWTADPGDLSLDIDITSFSDGVYKLTISETGEDDYNIVIYELCTILACGTSLMDSLFQADVDPCCEDCDDDITEAMWKQRHDLNSMIYYLGYLLSYINVESILYLGVGDLDTTRQEYINRVGDYVDKLLVIADRCGECD